MENSKILKKGLNMKYISYLAILAFCLLSGCMYPEKPRPLFVKHINKSNLIIDSYPVETPVDVVSTDKGIYVLSSSQSKVYVFDDGLSLQRTIDISATNPMGLTLDYDGRIYIADTGGNRILRYTNDGTFDATFGSGGIVGQSGTGDGQFNSPWGIAIDDEFSNGKYIPDKIYVSDSGNDRIQILNSNGKFISQWANQETTGGQLDKPAGIYFLSGGLHGHLLVACKNNNSVQRLYGSSGGFCDSPSSGGFKEPTDICHNRYNDEIIVTDAGNNRLLIFDERKFYLVKEIGGIGLKNPMGVACNDISSENQILYVADTGNNRILRLEVADYKIGSSPEDVFKKMKLALKKNNIEKALSYFHGDVRNSYREALKGGKGSEFDAFLNSSDKLIFNMDLGISKMYDFEAPDGYLYPIEFKKDIFGNWKIIRF